MIKELFELLERTDDVERITRWASHFSMRTFDRVAIFQIDQKQAKSDYQWCLVRLRQLGQTVIVADLERIHANRRDLQNAQDNLEADLRMLQREEEDDD